MGSTFGGLGIASTSLAAQRRAIETAGHNIANVNTPGYNRQRVDMAALVSGGAGLHTGALAQPNGVDIVAQTRIVDTFVTERMNRETAAMGSANVLRDAWGTIESAYNEPGENGLAAQLEGLWDAWDTVVTRPEDLSVRTALLQKAQAVTDGFNSLHARISQVGTDALDRAAIAVNDVNRITEGIASLNTTIAAQQAAGTPANDLMDQRDNLVRELSGHVQVRTRTEDNGMLTVFVSGSSLVIGNRSTDLELDTSGAGAVLRMVGSGTEVTPAEGTIPKLLEVANTMVPGQLAALDGVARSLATAVNDQHALGHDLQGAIGQKFFSFTDDPDNTAAGLKVADDLLGDPSLVAAAAPSGTATLDGSNAAKIAEIGSKPGGPAETYRSMVATLGVQANKANARVSLQTEVVQSLQDERDAVSGVSLDEEMTNLIAFQQAYQASARYLTAVDEMLSTLINSTGLVGR